MSHNHFLFSMVKLEIFIPVTYLDKISDVLRSVNAGAIGLYDSALSYSPVKGRWRPLPGAEPYNGEIGKLCEADEYKIEVICRAENIEKTIHAVKSVHPYELPVINVIPLLLTGLDE